MKQPFFPRSVNSFVCFCFSLKIALSHERHRVAAQEISMQHASLPISVSLVTDQVRAEGYSEAGPLGGPAGSKESPG